MESKIIKCPKCGVGLKVDNPRDEAVKSIKCPKCLTPLKVVFREPKATAARIDPAATQLPGKPAAQSAGPETQYGPQPAQPGGATQLGSQPGGDATRVKAKLQPGRLFCNGREYPLQMGRNIVGRRNHTRPTTVMLDVNDSYMSREHILINVEQVGDKLRATVTNYQNTNETKVAGLPLAKGDMVVLNNGMTITMGETTVTYRT